MACGDYLIAQPDGLVTRPGGKWVIEKLDYLERYMDMFTRSMQSQPWRAINYIELFAGPGKYQIKDTDQIVLGSPLISLMLRQSFSRYYFVELDEERLDALKTRCSRSSLEDRIKYYQGDCNDVVFKIVDELNDINAKNLSGDQWQCLNLAFVDPDGLNVDWKTIEELAKVRTDLIIHYSQMGITRNIELAYQQDPPTSLDKFFGCENWRSVYEKYRGRFLHRNLINLYEARLKNLGYQDIKSFEPLIRSTKRKAPLYRLIFASKHPLGHKFWSEVTKRDVHGQRRLL